MNTQNKGFKIFGIVVLVILVTILTNFVEKPSVSKLGGSASGGGLLIENYLPYVLQNGGIVTGLPITEANTGTSTLNLKSTSATKGFCIEANATSSATVINITATTTTNSGGGQSGLQISYGACL